MTYFEFLADTSQEESPAAYDAWVASQADYVARMQGADLTSDSGWWPSGYPLGKAYREGGEIVASTLSEVGAGAVAEAKWLGNTAMDVVWGAINELKAIVGGAWDGIFGGEGLLASLETPAVMLIAMLALMAILFR